KTMPLTMAGIVIGGISLVGIPGTVGFITKWYLLLAALEEASLGIIIAIVVGSLLALVYVWRIVEAAYFRSAPAGETPVREAPLSLLLPLWVLVVANIYFGIDTRLPLEVSGSIAALLTGGAQ